MSHVHIKRANLWRDGLNPLRQLTISRLVSLLEEGERGSYAELQWLYRTIEKRDPILRAGKRRRLAAIKKLDWRIRTIPEEHLPVGVTPVMAEAQANFLYQAYESVENLKEAVEWLALAEFRGFSHLEKHYIEKNKQLKIHRLEPVPQWHWFREGINGDWKYDAESLGRLASEGVSANPQHFIIREVSDPINEIAAISFVRRSMSQKDWDGFIETYGIPPLFIEMPANVPSDRESEYLNVAEDIIADARGVLPNGTRIHTIQDGSRGANPFKEHIQYQDELLILAITGGKLTMLNESTGIGGSQARVHQDTFDELARAEAGEISEIFQKQFDQPFLQELLAQDPNFGTEPVAYFELVAQSSPNVDETIEQAKELNAAGYRVNVQELSDMTGYKLQDKELELPVEEKFETHNQEKQEPMPHKVWNSLRNIFKRKES